MLDLQNFDGTARCPWADAVHNEPRDIDSSPQCVTRGSVFAFKIPDLLGDVDGGADGAEKGDERLDDVGNGLHEAGNWTRDAGNWSDNFAEEAFLFWAGSGGEGEGIG